MRTGKLFCVALLLLGRTAAATDSQQPVACGNCHKAQAFAQPLTPMGQAMQLPGKNALLEKHPRLTFRDGVYTYTVETANGKSVYTVGDGKRSISLPVLWSMGAQAQTWVLERDGQMYESAVSYYPSLDGLSITTGHEQLAPKTLDEAIGKPLSATIARECFNCHATGAVVDHRLDLTSLKPGVGCEHCHVGANEHMAAIMQGDLSPKTPPPLGEMSSENLSNFCGQCHRSWELVVRSRWSGVANVRFQPYRLANSKCFNGTDPRISCVACHDPHQPLEKSASYYDAKCLACHAPPSTAMTAATPGARHPTSCPVAKTNCTSCHMPRVQVTNGHIEFTDHQIRVVKPGDPYPN